MNSAERSYIMSMTEIDRIQYLICYPFDHHFWYTKLRKKCHGLGKNIFITHFDVIQVRQVLFDHNIRILNEVYVFVWF